MRTPRGTLRAYFERHPGAMIVEAVGFVALAVLLLITDPNGTSRGIPMWLACPVLIVIMVFCGASGVRRVRARRRDA